LLLSLYRYLQLLPFFPLHFSLEDIDVPLLCCTAGFLNNLSLTRLLMKFVSQADEHVWAVKWERISLLKGTSHVITTDAFTAEMTQFNLLVSIQVQNTSFKISELCSIYTTAIYNYQQSPILKRISRRNANDG